VSVAGERRPPGPGWTFGSFAVFTACS